MGLFGKGSIERRLAALLAAGALLALAATPAFAHVGSQSSAASMRAVLLQAEAFGAEEDELDELDELDGDDAADEDADADEDAGQQGDVDEDEDSNEDSDDQGEDADDDRRLRLRL